jgi:hypothetical protein
VRTCQSNSGDANPIRAGNIPDELLEGRRNLKWVIGKNSDLTVGDREQARSYRQIRSLQRASRRSELARDSQHFYRQQAGSYRYNKDNGDIQ